MFTIYQLVIRISLAHPPHFRDFHGYLATNQSIKASALTIPTQQFRIEPTESTELVELIR